MPLHREKHASRTLVVLCCALLGGAAFVAGCAASPSEPAAEPAAEPAWAPPWGWKEGSVAVLEPVGPVLYAVGSVSGIRSDKLRETTAANRARSELGKALSRYLGDLWRHYHTTPYAQAEPAPAPHEAPLCTDTGAMLALANIVDTAQGPDGVGFALARLHLDVVRLVGSQTSCVTQAQRAFLEAEADTYAHAHVTAQGDAATPVCVAALRGGDGEHSWEGRSRLWVPCNRGAEPTPIEAHVAGRVLQGEARAGAVTAADAREDKATLAGELPACSFRVTFHNEVGQPKGQLLDVACAGALAPWPLKSAAGGE